MSEACVRRANHTRKRCAVLRKRAGLTTLEPSAPEMAFLRRPPAASADDAYEYERTGHLFVAVSALVHRNAFGVPEAAMISLTIPDFGNLTLAHLVLDYNGTLAVDGKLLDGVRDELALLSRRLELHVVTGNTYGDAADRLTGLNVKVTTLDARNQAAAKRHYVERLGSDYTAAIGNGRNDAPMLRTAALGIAVLGTEGSALGAITAADIVVRHVIDALGLLLHTKRLVATLRA